MKKYPFIDNNVDLTNTDYPMLRDYAKAKKKPIKTSHSFNMNDLDEALCEEIHQFLSHKSLKDALRESLEISSPQICDFINTNMFKETETQIELNLIYYLIADTTAQIFIRQEKPNPDGFLRVLAQRPVFAMLAPLYNRRLQLQKFLNDNFSEEKKIEVLENSTRKDEVTDLLNMYMQDDQFFKTYLEGQNFRQLSSLRHCHDLIAAQLQKLKTVNFQLKQETHWPAIKELHNKVIYKDFYLVVPDSHHDLITWGNILGHCIGGRHYAEQAYKGQSLLLGVADKSRLRFTMEIRNKHIAQIQGVSRSAPDRELQKAIDKALIEAKLLRD